MAPQPPQSARPVPPGRGVALVVHPRLQAAKLAQKEPGTMLLVLHSRALARNVPRALGAIVSGPILPVLAQHALPESGATHQVQPPKQTASTAKPGLGAISQVLQSTAAAPNARLDFGATGSERARPALARLAVPESGATRPVPLLLPIASIARRVLGAILRVLRRRRAARHAPRAHGANLGGQTPRALVLHARRVSINPQSARPMNPYAFDVLPAFTALCQVLRLVPSAQRAAGTVTLRRQHAPFVLRASGHTRPELCGRAIVRRV